MSSMASDGVGDGSRGDADKLAANLDDHGAVQVRQGRARKNIAVLHYDYGVLLVSDIRLRSMRVTNILVHEYFVMVHV